MHTYDVSMNARPKGHIAIKLYKEAEAHPIITKQIVLKKAALLRFVIFSHSDNTKDLTFQVFRLFAEG